MTQFVTTKHFTRTLTYINLKDSAARKGPKNISWILIYINFHIGHLIAIYHLF